MADNYVAVWRALGLSREELVRIAANGFKAAFLTEEEKRELLDEVDLYAAAR